MIIPILLVKEASVMDAQGLQREKNDKQERGCPWNQLITIWTSMPCSFYRFKKTTAISVEYT